MDTSPRLREEIDFERSEKSGEGAFPQSSERADRPPHPDCFAPTPDQVRGSLSRKRER